MWIASLLRACFMTSKLASPDATSAAAQSRPYSADEDIPLRHKVPCYLARLCPDVLASLRKCQKTYCCRAGKSNAQRHCTPR